MPVINNPSAHASTTPANNSVSGPHGNGANTSTTHEINKDLNMYKAVLKNELLGTSIDSITSNVLQPRIVPSVFQVSHDLAFIFKTVKVI